MRLRGRDIILLLASTKIIAKSSIGTSQALRLKPYRNPQFLFLPLRKRLELEVYRFRK
jgi:hypothetical protein